MEIVNGIVMLVIAVILFTDVLIPTILNANTSGWTTAMTSMWSVAKFLGAVAIVVLVAREVGL